MTATADNMTPLALCTFRDLAEEIQRRDPDGALLVVLPRGEPQAIFAAFGKVPMLQAIIIHSADRISRLAGGPMS